MRTIVSFDDVLLVPKYSEVMSRKDCDTTVWLGSELDDNPIKLKVPILSAPMDTVCGDEMAIALDKIGGLGIIHRYNTIEQQLEMVKKVYNVGARCGVAIAATGDFEERALANYDIGVRFVCVDTANGHNQQTINAVKRLSTHPKLNGLYILTGNVGTARGAYDLWEAGANGIRLGIGSGINCSTQTVTGFGYPTLQTVMDVSKWFGGELLKGEIGPDLIADGGINNSGAAVKALVAGAKCVMLGGVLAKCEESLGKIMYQMDGKKVKVMRGMASGAAFKDWKGDEKNCIPEGESTQVVVEGTVEQVIGRFVGGIRSGMSYAGVTKIHDLKGAAEFVMVTNNGLIEGKPHAKL